jgi:hypothetical protein
MRSVGSGVATKALVSLWQAARVVSDRANWFVI